MNHLLKYLAAVSVAAWVALPPSAVRADLVTNGGFEADGTVDYSGGILPPITGWSVSGQRVNVLNGSPSAVTDGSFRLGFDDGLAFPLSNPGSGSHSGVITQTVATTIGTKYALTFDYGAIGGAAAFPQKLNMQVIGATTLSNQTITKSLPVYGSHTVIFKANSTSTTLRFADATSNGEIGQSDGILDNVHVNVDDPLNLTVANPSFENIDVTTNTANNTSENRFSGWLVEAPTSNPLLIDDTSTGRINGKDGVQFIQFNNTLGTATQMLKGLVDRNTSYALTVGIGVALGDFNALGHFASQGATLSLLAQDPNGVQTLLGSTTISAATINDPSTLGSLVDYTLTVPFTSISPAVRGQQLVIRITSNYPLGGNSENIFDNVRFTALPEPASLALLMTGGSLVLVRRRK